MSWRFVTLAAPLIIGACGGNADTPVDSSGAGGGQAAGGGEAGSSAAGSGAAGLSGGGGQAGAPAGAAGTNGAGASGAATVPCSEACGAPACPCPKTATVTFTMPSGQVVHIDAFESTQGDYASFLAANPSASAVPECNGSSQFAPGSTTVSCMDTPYQPMLKPLHPVGCVDWCQADRFCRWSNKRLCTGIEWRAACSKSDAQKYPYGNTKMDGFCNVPPSKDAQVVGAAKQCEGGYPGLFDMVGNVREWTSLCDTSGCKMRGIAAGDIIPEGDCSFESYAPRTTQVAGVGMRCCSTD